MRWATIPQLLSSLLTLTPATLALDSRDLYVQAGHHVVFSYSGVQPPDYLFDLIEQGKVGGIIFFGENVVDNLTTTIDAFQDAFKQSPGYPGSPLLILTDQEGGQVVRLPRGPTMSAKQVGQSRDPKSSARQTGKIAADALKAYHINANLAPVLGVYRKAGDFLNNYERSYGNSSSLVTTCASVFIHAQQDAGFLATAKHFPGLGAAETNENTDEAPVTIDLTLNELRVVDEAPYVSAIAAGVGMVMASWALYPALDPKLPSGLSTSWIQDELRGRLGFEGVTITDAIEAGALEAFGDDPARAVLASQAGMDIILASARNVTQGEAVVEALVSALQDGSLTQHSFAQATDRILELRQKIVV